MIAKAVVAQVPPSVIAEKIGVDREIVRKELQAPETQAFIRGALAPYLDDISGLIPPALTAVREGLHKSQQTADRLRAVKTLGYLMELAEGRKADGSWNDRPRRWAGTMEELLVLYRQTIDTPPWEERPGTA